MHAGEKQPGSAGMTQTACILLQIASIYQAVSIRFERLGKRRGDLLARQQLAIGAMAASAIEPGRVTQLGADGSCRAGGSRWLTTRACQFPVCLNKSVALNWGSVFVTSIFRDAKGSLAVSPSCFFHPQPWRGEWRGWMQYPGSSYSS